MRCGFSRKYCIIVPLHLSKDTNDLIFKTPAKQLYSKVSVFLFNISIDANSVDPDQTALQEQSDLDLHCLLKSSQNVSTDNKNNRLFVKCALRGQCI